MNKSTNHLFIVGSPRSGTTWLQSILSDHSKVASTIETKTFPDYVFPLVKAYKAEAIQSGKIKWPFGMPYLFDETEFKDLILSLIEATYSKIYNKNPDAEYLMEKHPLNIHFYDTILEFLPNSYFIHIVRDGREVVVSMLNAYKKVGFGEKHTMAAAERWKNAVNDGLQIKQRTSNYMEVKYEELLEEPHKVIERILIFLKLKYEQNQIADIVKKNDFNKAKDSLKSPDLNISFNPNHFNSGKTDTWKSKLNSLDKYKIELIAGDLLRKLGYSSKNWWYNNYFEKLIIPVVVLLGRIQRRVKKTIQFALIGKV